MICCSSFKPAIISLNFEKYTLIDFINMILKPQRDLTDFTISSGNDILYEENNYLEEDEISNYYIRSQKTLSSVFGTIQGEIKISVCK